MSLCIAGMGWVTPLGHGVSAVWNRLLAGEEATAEEITDPVGDQSYPAYRVPETATVNLPRHPRLRRASAISRFAAAAGLAALQDAGSLITAESASRTAVVFAISNGGVIYTKRFYRDIVTAGADKASPLLFPETVFNAPASHLSAIVGITGRTYTVVGDGAVGVAAVRVAEDLMMTDNSLEYCLLVAAEEADWILCDAYRKWRLLRRAPPIEPFQNPAKGMILSEGAGAILIAREGPIKIENTHPGEWFSRGKTVEPVKRILKALAAPDTEVVIGGANGTFIDEAEIEAVSELLPDAYLYSPKPALGESVGASGLWQIIIGAQALREKRLPPVLHVRSGVPGKIPLATMNAITSTRAIVLNCGLNQQVAGLRLSV